MRVFFCVCGVVCVCVHLCPLGEGSPLLVVWSCKILWKFCKSDLLFTNLMSNHGLCWTPRLPSQSLWFSSDPKKCHSLPQVTRFCFKRDDKHKEVPLMQQGGTGCVWGGDLLASLCWLWYGDCSIPVVLKLPEGWCLYPPVLSFLVTLVLVRSR